MDMRGPCRDHLGKEHPSGRDMCAAWGIHPSTFSGRLDRGWTLEQALTVPARGNGPKVNSRSKDPIKDHLGREFVSIGAMCRHWGLSEKVYWSRKRICKWPLEKILTTPVRERDDTANAVAVSDHLGQPFRSISAMCRHWKIGLSTYRERRKRGWDVGRALTGEEIRIKTDAVACEDHLGNPYPSKNAMCRAYGVTRYCYESRLALGWSQERALTEKRVVNARPCADAGGREFPATTYMALYYGLPAYAFHSRLKDPAAAIPALMARYWDGRDCGKYRNVRPLGYPWFAATVDGHRIVAHADAVLDEWHGKEMPPLPETDVKSPWLRAVKRLRWPWFLCEAGGSPAVLGWADLARLHAASNFGMSVPDQEADDRRMEP